MLVYRADIQEEEEKGWTEKASQGGDEWRRSRGVGRSI